MARSRQIKPSFYLDEDVADLSFPARLLFQGLWTLADRRGRLEDRPPWIRVQVFPYDNLETQHLSVNDMLDELAKPRKNRPGGFIIRYVVDGKAYIQIRNFERHQHPHPKEPESQIPSYQGIGEKPCNAAAQPCNYTAGKAGSSGSSGPSDVSESDTGAPPTYPLPPDLKAEKAIRDERWKNERALYAAVGAIAEKTGKDPGEVMERVTAYKRRDGSVAPGRKRPELLRSDEAVEKSLADAKAWLAQLEAAS